VFPRVAVAACVQCSRSRLWSRLGRGGTESDGLGAGLGDVSAPPHAVAATEHIQ